MLNNSSIYFGFVEDNVDPLKVGRVRVRVVGIHTSNKSDIPTEHLPWYSCVLPTNISSAVQPPPIGSQVILTPLDESLQQFLVLGVVPGISTEPDTPRVARNENTSDSIVAHKESNKLTGEPSGSYNTSYPNNFVIQSTGGNYLELDDTPEAKRIHLYHSSGAYQEFTNGGNITIRSAGSTYIINPTALNVYSTTNITGVTTITGATTVNGTFTVVGYMSVNSSGASIIGNITATGNITAYYSDDRLKVRLGKIENALDKVCSLTGFYYRPNEIAKGMGYEDNQEIGVSAQEVQAIAPEIVAPAPIDNNYLTVRYERLVPVLIEAIKELRDEIKQLQA